MVELPHRLPDFVLSEHLEEGCLSNFNRQCKIERIVEDRVAGLVGEIGNHDGVGRGELVTGKVAVESHGTPSHEEHRCRDSDPFTDPPHAQLFRSRDPFQIRAHLGRSLIALRSILFQRLSDDRR